VFYFVLFFACWFPVLPLPFVEKTILSPFNCLYSLSKTSSLPYVHLFFVSLFFPIDVPVCCFTNTSPSWLFQQVLKLSSVSSAALFFWIVFTILGLLPFHVNFRISLSIWTKLLSEFLMRLRKINGNWENQHPNTFKSFCLWMWNMCPWKVRHHIKAGISCEKGVLR
jgi:hypothetical protein